MGESNTVVEFDRLINQLDKVYAGFSCACGLSECAFWMLLDTASYGGEVTLARLRDEWCYSKQTINSALKTLTKKGLATLDFVEGSRKSKLVRLTPSGRAFAARYTEPAIEAEERAFDALGEEERAELMRLIGKFTGLLRDELTNYERRIAGPDTTSTDSSDIEGKEAREAAASVPQTV